MTNEERANRVERALIFYRVIVGDAHTNDEEDVIDFLTDLRHFCDRARLDLGSLDRIAHDHYLAELTEEPLPLLDQLLS